MSSPCRWLPPLALRVLCCVGLVLLALGVGPVTAGIGGARGSAAP